MAGRVAFVGARPVVPLPEATLASSSSRLPSAFWTHQMAWLERGFSQLASTKLTSKEVLAALTLLSGFVRHSALLQRELEEGRESGQDQAESEREYGEALNFVISNEQFPHISTMFTS